MANHLLGLPNEILQLVGESAHLNPSILRLVCKRFDGVYLDQFAAAYLHKLHCYVLDPQRLGRVKSIVDQPHLAARVKNFTLSLDPIEEKGSRGITTVPRASPWVDQNHVMVWDIKHEQRQDLKRITRTGYVEWIKQPQLDYSVLSHVLQQLCAAGCWCFTVRIVEEDMRDFWWEEKTNWFLPDSTLALIFGTVITSDCNITHLALGNTRFLDILSCDQRQFINEHLRRIGASLKVLELTLDQDDLNRVFNQGPRYVWPLFELIKDMQSLEYLWLTAQDCPRRKYDGTKLEPRYLYQARVTAMLFYLGRTGSLRELAISGVDCQQEALMRAVSSNRQLQVLMLCRFCLVSQAQDAWHSVFEHLRAQATDLRFLRLEALQEQSQLVIDAHGSHVSQMQFRVRDGEAATESDSLEKWVSTMDMTTRHEVERGLAAHVESGGVSFFKE